MTWPTSSLVISEVQTGGASASDEFAELHNAGAGDVDLAGLELVYVTSTGSTVTRKASWAASTILGPGRHLVVANAAGVVAPIADLTYSGGFAATGGAVVLRPIGGTPIDAVAWGDATNGFVEGAAAAAPPAGSSIERRPGGSAGNGVDTNDNSADFAVTSPTPQNLAAAPTGGGSPSPSVGPSAPPSSTPPPTPTPTPTPTPSPTPIPSPMPTSTPIPTPTATPTSTPTPTPTSTPTPSPSPTPVPTPTPEPTPVVRSIADARLLPDGTAVRVGGTLTTQLGAIDSGRNGFVQDGTAGIALRLDAALAVPLPAGTTVTVDGTLGSYFSLRVLNFTAATVSVTGSTTLPEPLGAATAAADETLEGLRLTVAGVVTEAPSSLADGLGVTIDDGSGALRLVVSATAQGGRSIHTGDLVTATGPLGQRDSSGTGVQGYRLHVTLDGELDVRPPTPSPTPSPSPTASPSPSPSPSADPSTSPAPSTSPTTAPSATPTPVPSASARPSSTPSASPSSTPVAMTIASARSLTAGSKVSIHGVVIAQPGRLGTPALAAIDDGTAGIVVRLGDYASHATLGSAVEIAGTLADPYGQLEVRALTAFAVTGAGTPPTPISIGGSGLGESTEGRLVTISGTVDGRPVKSTSGDLAIVVSTTDGSARVLADASAGLGPPFVTKGDRVRITGVAGQHASRKGALDGYRIWLRGPADVVRLGGGPGASAQPSPSGSAVTAGAPLRSIAGAIAAGSGNVTIEAVVTAPARLLDTSNRRVVVQDASGAIEVLLPTGGKPPALGRRVRIAGEVGRAYGAPRLRAATVNTIGAGAAAPIELRTGPGAAHEWRLVRVRGDVVGVHRSGDRWTAELLVGGVRVLVIGMAGAAIPSGAILEGRSAVVSGIVRRPYPTATDRRFAILPRSSADLVLGGSADDRSATPSGAPGAATAAASGDAPNGPREIDLIDLGANAGADVRVGGLVSAIRPDGFTLDDGTAVAEVALVGAAADVAGSLVDGDAVTVSGRVVAGAGGAAPHLAVSDPAAIVLAGDLGGDDPAASNSTPGDAAPATATASPVPAALSGTLGGPGPTDAGIVGIIGLSIASLAVTVLRRRQMRRRLAARIAARLASVGSSASPTAAPPSGLEAGPAGR